MTYSIRQAQWLDAPQLESLLVAYMRETYRSAWGGTVRQLERDIIEGAIRIIVAETGGKQIAGFVAWTETYDLHWCFKGGMVIDFYVAPPYRGTGAALFLVIESATAIQQSGGTFLHGGAVENESVRRLYQRIAMVQPNGECYVSGRAFRHLAGMTNKTWRDAVKNLPPAEWNYQP